MNLLAAAAGLLAARGTRHAVIGAAALAVHGVSRATGDIDLLVVDSACLDEVYWAPLRGTDSAVDIRRGDGEDPLAGVVRLRRPGTPPVDVVVGKVGWQAGVIERARPTEIEGIVIAVVGAADLVLLKLYAGGSQDAWDIRQVLGAPDRDALVADVEQRLDLLPSASQALWRRLREEDTREPRNG